MAFYAQSRRKIRTVSNLVFYAQSRRKIRTVSNLVFYAVKEENQDSK